MGLVMDPLRVFSYLTADKATQYRTVMRVFLAAKERFSIHLRADDVAASLGDEPGAAASDVEPLLDTLLDDLDRPR